MQWKTERGWVIEKVVEDDLASTSLEVALLDLNMLICFGARANGKRIRSPAAGGIASTAAQ